MSRRASADRAAATLARANELTRAERGHIEAADAAALRRIHEERGASSASLLSSLGNGSSGS